MGRRLLVAYWTIIMIMVMTKMVFTDYDDADDYYDDNDYGYVLLCMLDGGMEDV